MKPKLFDLSGLKRRILSSSLFSSASIYIIANIINSAIPFLMLPVLTRYMSPKDYGIVAMFQVLLGMTGTFTGLSVHGAISRQYFERDTIDYPKYITNCLYILFTSAVVVGICLGLFSGWIKWLTDFPSEWIWAVLVTSTGQFVTLVALCLWQVQVRPFTYGSFKIIQTMTNVGLSLRFVVGLAMSWQGWIQAQVISMTLFALFALLALWKEGWLKKGYDGGYVRHALKFGIPLVPHSLGAWSKTATDRVLIAQMIGLADAGIYVVGAQIGMVIGLLADSFNRAWVPWFFGQLKENDAAKRLRIVKITYLYGFFILMLSLCLSLTAPWFLRFFLGKDFTGSIKYVIWIAFGYAFNGMYKMVTNYIFYVQKTYILAWITFVSASFNVVISYTLIRLNGAIGAAQGTMIAFLMLLILTWISADKVYKMPWRLKI